MVVYTRKSTLPKTVTSYFIKNTHVVEVKCYKEDNSWYREQGVMLNGKEVPDKYVVSFRGVKGDASCEKFVDKKEANDYVKALLSFYGDFVKSVK